MNSTIIYNVAVWKWNAEAGFPVSGSTIGEATPNSFVVMQNGFITKVSNNDEQLPSFADFDTVIDGNGRLLLPGLMGNFVGDQLTST